MVDDELSRDELLAIAGRVAPDAVVGVENDASEGIFEAEGDIAVRVAVTLMEMLVD